MFSRYIICWLVWDCNHYYVEYYKEEKDDWGIKGVLYEDMLDSLVKKLLQAKLKEWGL